jgi:hypothetical protein
MDWTLAIERNREALKRILAGLVAMAALADGPRVGAPTLPRHLYRAVLRLLRPAEAAARRLIIVMARGLVVTHSPASQGVGNGLAKPDERLRNGPLERTNARRHRRAEPPSSAPRTLSLPLFDPLRLPHGRRPTQSAVPRISVPGFTLPHPVPVRLPPSSDDLVSAARIALRLAALGRALDDLPRQAQRFARWRARRDLALKTRRPHRVSPLRPGPAYGVRRPHSRRRAHEVDEVLRDLHYFAHCALHGPDTS